MQPRFRNLVYLSNFCVLSCWIKRKLSLFYKHIHDPLQFKNLNSGWLKFGEGRSGGSRLSHSRNANPNRPAHKSAATFSGPMELKARAARTAGVRNPSSPPQTFPDRKQREAFPEVEITGCGNAAETCCGGGDVATGLSACECSPTR